MDYEKVVEHFGSPAALARALGIKRQAISQWEGQIPLTRQYQIQVITKGKFKAQEPDAA